MQRLAIIEKGSISPEQSGHDARKSGRLWIPTFSGRTFNVVEPSSRDISIRDIAHSLSMQCRFGGHCQRYYSVAEHGLLLSRLYSAAYSESKCFARQGAGLKALRRLSRKERVLAARLWRGPRSATTGASGILQSGSSRTRRPAERSSATSHSERRIMPRPARAQSRMTSPSLHDTPTATRTVSDFPPCF